MANTEQYIPILLIFECFLLSLHSLYNTGILIIPANLKMDKGTSSQQSKHDHPPRQLRKGTEIALHPSVPLGNEEAAGQIAVAAAAAAQMIPSMYFAKGREMGEISQRITGLSEENNKLREKLKTFKKDNTAMNQKIGSLENRNQKQGETIRALESSQEKLQKELENVKKAKERLRIEIEEKTSKFSTENKILTEKLEALTKDFEEVENENKELKHTLEELTRSNNSLKEMVESIREENQQLREDVGSLKTEHKEISAKMECKEVRLALGQVAWMLEAEIWKIVLPDQKMGVTGILKSMERWLKKNSTTVEGKAAQKRWDELKVKLQWDDEDHKGALSCLKKLRLVDAHPENVDLEEARKQLNEGDYVAETDKESCEEIINMVTTVKILNNSK
ncbi:girdin-like [Dendronephthya gigantea]|uniref:girdin-like n=1 Tax=Dendronephthya gigantea TaxID=151771 RepID=UPI00106D4348|nr:girdin-like [Dendronephthya gigantea]